MTTGGKLVVVSGPSGVGKSTVCSELLKLSCFRRVITCTTREPRSGEKHGRDYYFLSRREFQEKIERNEFLEHVTVHGHRYGTLRAQVGACASQGHYALLAIDVQGAEQLRRNAGCAAAPEEVTSTETVTGWNDKDLVTIFLAPPDLETLRDRLRKRGTETHDQVTVRMRTAEDEMAVKDAYDYVITNGDLRETVQDIVKCLEVPETLHGTK